MKAMCRQCEYLNWDWLTHEYESGPYFCGLHGRASVDPDGEQPDLNHKGGCGFSPSSEPRQYNLFL